MKKPIHTILNDLGFGNKVLEADQRLMNRDGSSNVVRRGLPFLRSVSIYHELITMSWWKFNFVIFLCYLFVNLFFSCLYFFGDIDNLNGMIATNPLEKFWEAFFFSTQTLSTVGFGRLNPQGFFNSSIAAIESMIGLLGFALATGLLYGRFSRPVAKLVFSSKAVVAPYQGGKGLMFRLANLNKSQLLEVEADVNLSVVENENGNQVRKYFTLELERKRITILAMTWTVVHPIDENSPFANWSADDFLNKDFELLIMIKAFEQTFSQTVYSRTSYRHHEVVYGAKYISALEPGPHGRTIVDFSKIDSFEKADLAS